MSALLVSALLHHLPTLLFFIFGQTTLLVCISIDEKIETLMILLIGDFLEEKYFRSNF